MSVVTRKSGQITNRDAVPEVPNNSAVSGGDVFQTCGYIAPVTGDTSTSVYIFCTVPSNARISSVELWSDALGSLTTLHLGVQRTTEDGSGSVSNQLFASAINVHTAATAGTNEVYQAGVSGASSVSAMESTLWQILGLASDPNLMYDVIGTLATTCDAGGNMALKVSYVI